MLNRPDSSIERGKNQRKLLHLSKANSSTETLESKDATFLLSESWKSSQSNEENGHWLCLLTLNGT